MKREKIEELLSNAETSEELDNLFQKYESCGVSIYDVMDSNGLESEIASNTSDFNEQRILRGLYKSGDLLSHVTYWGSEQIVMFADDVDKAIVKALNNIRSNK